MVKIFIPDRFADRIPPGCASREPAVVTIKGYKIAGFNLTLTEEQATSHFSGDNEPAKAYIVTDDEPVTEPDLCTAFFFTEGWIGVDSSGSPRAPLLASKNAHTLDAVTDELMLLATLSGKCISLHVTQNRIHYPDNNDRMLNVVLGALPPGDSEYFRGTHIGENRLDPNCKEVRFPGVAYGYGLTAVDDEDNRVGQIVGNTIYLCVPVSKNYVHVLAGNGMDVFRTALRLTWNRSVDKRNVRRQANIVTSVDGYTKIRNQVSNRFDQFHTEELRKTNEEIAEIGRRLARLMTKKREIIKYQGNDPFAVSAETIASEWDTLRSLPDVDFVECADGDHLHVHTKDILHLDDNGRLRNIGRFIIRLFDSSEVHVWSKRLTHPGKIQHPHIGEDGSVCFGNITTEIAELMSECKYAEVIKLVLGWLKEGYDASLTVHKLEEWPLAEAVDDSRVVDLSEVFLPYPKDKAEDTPEEGVAA